jgi:hypothetical protein
MVRRWGERRWARLMLPFLKPRSHKPIFRGKQLINDYTKKEDERDLAVVRLFTRPHPNPPDPRCRLRAMKPFAREPGGAVRHSSTEMKVLNPIVKSLCMSREVGLVTHSKQILVLCPIHDHSDRPGAGCSTVEDGFGQLLSIGRLKLSRLRRHFVKICLELHHALQACTLPLEPCLLCNSSADPDHSLAIAPGFDGSHDGLGPSPWPIVDGTTIDKALASEGVG